MVIITRSLFLLLFLVIITVITVIITVIITLPGAPASRRLSHLFATGS